MKEYKRFSNDILCATDGLRKLIIDNPELPILVFTNRNDGLSGYDEVLLTDISAYVGEVLDCVPDFNESTIYTDRYFFEEDLKDYYNDDFDNDEEFDKFIKQKLNEYGAYWKDCIIVSADCQR